MKGSDIMKDDIKCYLMIVGTFAIALVALTKGAQNQIRIDQLFKRES